MISLIDAVVAVARADKARWARFCHEQAALLTPSGCRRYETDYAAERNLREWFVPHNEWLRLDGWAEQFILDLFSAAGNGHCRIYGLISLKKTEIPANVFFSMGFVQDNCWNKERLWRNELRLPDGTLVIAVDVEFPAGDEAQMPPKNLDESNDVSTSLNKRGRGRPPHVRESVDAWLAENPSEITKRRDGKLIPATVIAEQWAKHNRGVGDIATAARHILKRRKERQKDFKTKQIM